MISRDMSEAIERISRRSETRRSEDELEADFKKAMRDLRAKQVIHADDKFFRTSFETLVEARPFFEAHFGSEGYEMKINHRACYVVLLPGEIGMTNRRAFLKRDETLILLMLRVLWHERGQTGDIDEMGRVQIDSETLV